MFTFRIGESAAALASVSTVSDDRFYSELMMYFDYFNSKNNQRGKVS